MWRGERDVMFFCFIHLFTALPSRGNHFRNVKMLLLFNRNISSRYRNIYFPSFVHRILCRDCATIFKVILFLALVKTIVSMFYYSEMRVLSTWKDR